MSENTALNPPNRKTTSPTEESKAHRKVLEALSGLLLGMFVSMLASTVVSTSLPTIIHDLKGTQSSLTWVVTAMLLTTAISTPIWGKLADLTNRKVLFQIAIVIFVLATAAGGFSPNVEMLITCRALQGLGAGGLAALSQVILSDIISPRERGRYMGLFGAVMAVATVGGPLLGGVITDAWGWRMNFFVTLPFAVAALILVQVTLNLPPIKARKVNIDYLGIILLSASVSLLLIWITMAGENFGWISWPTFLMVGGAIVAGVLFVVVEVKSKEPLVPISLFKGLTFSLAVIASIATGLTMFGASVFLGQYMQLARGATPTQAGLMTIPMIAGLLLSSVIVGSLISRFGSWKPYLVCGSIVLIAGTALISTIHYNTNFVLVSIFMFLLGAGVGMTMQNLVLVVQNTAKASQIGVASAGVTFFRSLGGTIGVSVMGAIVAASVTAIIKDHQLDMMRIIAQLAPADKAKAMAQLTSGSLPHVVDLPGPIRTIFEDAYAQSISHAFLVAVPFAIISLIAVIFMPNKKLSQMTTSERASAGNADLATVSVGSAMEKIPVTGTLPRIPQVMAQNPAVSGGSASAGSRGDTPEVVADTGESSGGRKHARGNEPEGTEGHHHGRHVASFEDRP